MFDLRFFRDKKGRVPVLEALDSLPELAQAKGYVCIEQLAEKENQLKRPTSDYLRDGIYELRWRVVKVQYRLLYGFAGKGVIFLSHIITKENEVPVKEIDRCIANKCLFEQDPEKYSYSEG